MIVTQLRPATLADLYPLWLWANDPHATANSGPSGRERIPWPAHVQWFQKQPAKSILIATGPHWQPVGTVRIKPGGEMSWTVAPEVRGLGVGTRMVAAAVHKWADRNPWARIQAGNVASRKIAERAGLRVEVV